MKEQILSTATDLFLNLGFKSVTMDDIAQAMGISKKTIYAHFNTKNKLIEATSLYIVDNIEKGISEIKSQNKNPIEELFAMKDFTLEYLQNEKTSPQFQLEKFYPEIYSHLQNNHFSLFHSAIEDNLREGIKNGWYRKSLHVEFIAKIYFVGIKGMKDPSLFPVAGTTTKEMYNNFLEYHLRAIVTPVGYKKLNEFITTED